MCSARSPNLNAPSCTRTMTGLAAARSRGRVGGRPHALTGARLAHARELAAAGTPVREIAVLLGVARSTVYNTLWAARPAHPQVRPSEQQWPHAMR
jgi:DNA invertase Pin-like site-specific DNA recombinase